MKEWNLVSLLDFYCCDNGWSESTVGPALWIGRDWDEQSIHGLPV